MTLEEQRALSTKARELSELLLSSGRVSEDVVRERLDELEELAEVAL